MCVKRCASLLEGRGEVSNFSQVTLLHSNKGISHQHHACTKQAAFDPPSTRNHHAHRMVSTTDVKPASLCYGREQLIPVSSEEEG